MAVVHAARPGATSSTQRTTPSSLRLLHCSRAFLRPRSATTAPALGHSLNHDPMLTLLLAALGLVTTGCVSQDPHGVLTLRIESEGTSGSAGSVERKRCDAHRRRRARERSEVPPPSRTLLKREGAVALREGGNGGGRAALCRRSAGAAPPVPGLDWRGAVSLPKLLEQAGRG